MTQDSLERFENVIVDELCAYQAWLNSTVSPAVASRSDLEIEDHLLPGQSELGDLESVIPPEVRRSLDEFRHCLDVLHQVRIQTQSKPIESTPTMFAAPSGNRGGPSPSDLHGGPDWSHIAPIGSGLPTRIGRFQIRRRIGVGGFGIVYLGFDPVARRERAIKIPRPEFLGCVPLMERFQREVSAVALLDHPNIVPVLESNFHGLTPYIVMPYVSDMTLAGWRGSQSGISPKVAAEIVRQLADGMAHAHERGVLHRDVKPGNVLLASRANQAGSGTDGDELPFVPRLTDFGMAKQVATEISQEIDQTHTGMIIGTICYMSPEQAEGRNKDVTARSDVYGLGATLFEMLTGAPPYRGANDLQTLQNISRNEPLDLHRRDLKPIPQDLQVICLKALEKDPRKRFDSAAEFSAELGRFLQGFPIHSRPIAPIDRCWRWCRRRPGMAGMTVLGIAAVIAIAALMAESRIAHQRNLMEYTRSLEKLNRELETTADYAKKQQEIAEENESRAKDGLYAYEINRAAVAWKKEDTTDMIELLDRHIPEPGEIDRRGFEWWYLRRQASLAKRVLLDVGSPVYVLQFSPDHSVLASAGKDSIVRFFDPETGVVHHQFPTGQMEINGIAFSPDGKELATSGDDGTIRIWNFASGNERLKITTPFGKAFGLAFSPDGTRIVCTGNSAVICLFDARTGATSETLSGHTKEVEHIVFSDDGSTLVSTSHDNSIHIWKLNDRTCDDIIHDLGEDHVSDVEPLILLQDRKLLITGDPQGELRTINLDQKRLISRIKQLDGINRLSLHPDGCLLAAGDSRGKVRLRLLGENGELTGEEYKTWQAHQKKITALVWSADGSQLITASNDGQILTWSLQELLREEPRYLQLDSGYDLAQFPKMPFRVTNGPPAGTLIRRGAENGYVPVSTFGTSYSRWSLSADGKYLAASQRDNTIVTLYAIPADPTRPIDDVVLATWDCGGRVDFFCFSPDSQSLLVTYVPQVTNEADTKEASHAISLSVPHLHSSGTLPFPFVREAKYAPNGKQILFHTLDELILWNIWNETIAWRVPSKIVVQAVFSSDGTMIAIVSKYRQVLIRRSVDGAIQHRFANQTNFDYRPVQNIAFSPDNRTLVFETASRLLRFCHVPTGQNFFEIQLSDEVQEIQFTEDGRQLFCQVGEVLGLDNSPQAIVVFDASDRTEE